jgi:hypothetical protein
VAAQVRDPLVSAVTRPGVHLDHLGLACGGPDADNQAQELSTHEGLAKGFFRTGAIARMHHFKKRHPPQMVERPAQEFLLGQTRFDPSEGLGIEAIDHVDDREAARNEHVVGLGRSGGGGIVQSASGKRCPVLAALL